MNQSMAEFDTFAEQYDFWTETLGSSGHDEELYEDILGYLPEGVSTALDAGCGSGRHALHLAKYVPQVVAFDVSYSMISIAKRRQRHLRKENVLFVIADFAHLPFRCAAFDFILSINAMHEGKVHALLPPTDSTAKPRAHILISDVVTPHPSLDALPAWRIFLSLTNAPRYLVRYGPRTALRLLRFELNPRWIRHGCDHVRRGDRMSPSKFEASYRRLLPGSTFKRYGWRSVVFWRSPRHD
jgi:SAM-dependent methyltransferase